ncbi:MAG TPA: flagellar hook-length control protein FliK [Chroococcales cyanobacterium]|jgi:flagellar hook-length control protein FliK
MMNLPPPEATPRIAPKVERPEKTDKAERVEKKDPRPFLPEEKDDPSFIEELALASGAVLATPTLLPWNPGDFTPEADTSSLSRSASLSAPLSAEPQVPLPLQVFFPLPPAFVKVEPTELFNQAPVHLSPSFVPQWVAAEVQKLDAGGKTLTQLTVQLDPPHLGELQLTLSMVDRHVAVEIFAASQAKPLLETSLSSIRAILASQNLTATDIRISTTPSKNTSQREKDYPQPNRWVRKRSDDESMSVLT